MKKLIAFLLFAFSAPALAFSNPSLVYQTAISSATTVIVSVSTSSVTGATKMDNPQIPGRVATEVQNIDAAANLWCMLGSSNPVVNGGREITPGNTWVVSMSDRFLSPGFPQSSTIVNFWCLTDGAAATKAAVSQAY